MCFETITRKHEPHTRPGHSGELHWNAKLTESDIRDIIRMCNRGEAYSFIAESYGISRNHVRLLHRRERRGNE